MRLASLLLVSLSCVAGCGGSTSPSTGTTGPGSLGGSGGGSLGGSASIAGQAGATSAGGVAGGVSSVGGAANGGTSASSGSGGASNGGASGSGGATAGAAGASVIACVPPNDPPVPDPGAFVLACTLCSQLSACDPAQLTITFGDLTFCEQRAYAVLDIPLVVAEATYPALHPGCAAALAALSCDDFLTGVVPAECVAHPTGDELAMGSGCGFDDECASGLCADARSLASAYLPARCGACAPSPAPAMDAPCPDDRCAPGLVCTPDADADYTCQPYAKLGDSCATLYCAPTLACDAASRTCVPFLEQGDSCAGSTPGACDALRGLACDDFGASPTNTCQPTPQGSFCAGGDPCSAQQYCQMDDLAGACQPRVDDGGSCAASDDPLLSSPACQPLAICGGPDIAHPSCSVFSATTCNLL